MSVAGERSWTGRVREHAVAVLPPEVVAIPCALTGYVSQQNFDAQWISTQAGRRGDRRRAHLAGAQARRRPPLEWREMAAKAQSPERTGTSP